MRHLQRITLYPDQAIDHSIGLTVEQQHYLRRVLRLDGGDRFIAIDATGTWWLAELATEPNQAYLLEPVPIQTELPGRVVLLVAMPKGNGMDEIVRQVTELGVAEIVPVSSDRTLLQPSSQKVDRWQRIAREATEQCERQSIPTIHTPVPFAKALQSWNGSNFRAFVCEGRGCHPHLITYLRSPLTSTSHVIATGPEGGWTEQELHQAIAQGYCPVSLGARVLRAVTAPMVALSLMAAALEQG